MTVLLATNTYASGIDYPVVLSGTSGSPNTANETTTNPIAATAQWQFFTDGTVDYTLDGTETQWQDGTEWNTEQDSPTQDFWLMWDDEVVTSGAGVNTGSSAAEGVWHKISGTSSANVLIQWLQVPPSGTNDSRVRVRIASDSLGTNVVATGYYRGLAVVNS